MSNIVLLFHRPDLRHALDVPALHNRHVILQTLVTENTNPDATGEIWSAFHKSDPLLLLHYKR